MTTTTTNGLTIITDAKSDMDQICLPRILDMFELCMSGQAFKIFLRSSLAHTMNAFIGRLMCGLFSPSLLCCLTILAEERKREVVLNVTSAQFTTLSWEANLISIGVTCYFQKRNVISGLIITHNIAYLSPLCLPLLYIPDLATLQF